MNAIQTSRAQANEQVDGKVPSTAEVMIFNYSESNTPIQTTYIDGGPWFVASDVCDVLGLKNPTDILAKGLDEDEKLIYKLYRAGQNRKVNLVNESGLYNLIFKSRKPEAKVFRKWVTSEVLPAIRKKGFYGFGNAKNKHDFIDARSTPYSIMEFNGFEIRYIQIEGEIWFSINDIHRSIGSSTSANQSVKQLNAKETLAKKILLFGNTNPAWFTNNLGFQLLLSGSRILRNANQLKLELQ